MTPLLTSTHGLKRLALAALLMAGVSSAHAATDLVGTTGVDPILGVIGGPNYPVNGPGYAYTHNNNLGYIADGSLGTAEDTYGFFGTGINSSYVGFTLPTTDEVTSLTVNFRLDGDGGWFGENGERPGGSSGDNSLPLAPYLVEPTLQYTVDGTTWTNIGDVSDYLTVVGADTEGGGNTALVTFTLDTPLTGATAIRLEGTNGGIAGNGGGGSVGGFVAVAEENVYGTVPEPSTYAMIGLGMAGLFVVGRFIRRASAA